MVHEGRPGGPRCTPTPSSPATSSPARTPRGQRRRSAGARRSRAGSSARTASPSARPDAQPAPPPCRSHGRGGQFIGTIPRRRPRRPVRAARPGPRRRGPRLLPRSRRTSSGATADLSGKAAKDGPITVRLEPCGLATARLVGSRGQAARRLSRPVPHLDDRHARPGPLSADRGRPGRLAADRITSSRIDPTITPNLISDAQGRITFPALIPARPIGSSTDHAGRPDRPAGPQGIHRQARRDPRPGRHPDREAGRD